MGVHVVKLPNGDYQLGAEIEGVFVHFQTLSAGKVAQLVERQQNLAARAEEGDELARDQIGKPIDEQPADNGGLDGKTHGELDDYADAHEVADYPTSGNKAEKIAAIKAHNEQGEGV